MTRTYLDHNATSPTRPEAKEALFAALAGSAGNASSLHAEGRRARAIVEEARAQVAQLAGVPAAEVVFTSGGSEAIAAAIAGAAAQASGRKRIVVSSIEHSAVLASAHALIARGFEVVEMPCARTGRIDPDVAANVIDDTTLLVALQAANNETGVIQPVYEVGRAAKQAGALFLVDAVQAAGKATMERDLWNADLLALSGHKLGAPQGTGALIVRSGTALAPLIGGGAQERRHRGGTEAVGLIAGFGAACALQEPEVESKRLARLRDHLESRLTAIAPDVRIHGAEVPRLANTTNAAFPGIAGETLAIALDLAGFAISTGSACASGAAEPSHVIRAMGFDEPEARASIRISLGWSTSDSDVERFLDALPKVLARATMRGQ